MKRPSTSLIAVVTALAAVTGFAAMTAPGESGAASAAPAPQAARLPVERTSLLCPAPSTSDVAETLTTSYTPPGTAAPAAAGTTAPKPTAVLGIAKNPDAPALKKDAKAPG
ncbi:hypothetical protein ACFWEN_41760, partial [Streptomyces anthocyanicus]